MTTTAAGTAREGMTMSDETTRLRALLERIAMPWKALPTVVDGDGVPEKFAMVLCPHVASDHFYTVAEIEAVVREAHEAGWQVGVHANGDAAIDALIAAHAVEQAATVHSDDRDFGRFAGLRWHNPLA